MISDQNLNLHKDMKKSEMIKINVDISIFFIIFITLNDNHQDQK